VTRQSRRAFLAGTTGALAATAGCSGLPVVGDTDSEPNYDAERLQNAANPDERTIEAAHPGPVPNDLAEAHSERAQALLASVPVRPSIPNGVVASRIAESRATTAESIAAATTDVSTLDALDDWRADRAAAAEARGTYAAATGDIDGDSLRERRAGVRADRREFAADWTYRGANVVEALAVHSNVEDLVRRAGDALAPDRSFPSDPRAAVFDVGSLARDVEQARARIEDAAGLGDASVDDDARAYRDAIATAAQRLKRVRTVTANRVRPYIDASGVDDLDRDVEGTPAGWLFRRARHDARSGAEAATSSLERDDYATAVVDSGRALVAVLALESAVEAVQDGEHETPKSTDDILAARGRAVDAAEGVESVEPRPLADALAVRARSALHYADRELVGYPDSGPGGPTRRDAVEAVGGYALAVHVADAVPPVVDRVSGELRTAAGGEEQSSG